MAVSSTILSNPHPLWVVVLITLLFTSLARILRGVSLSGAIAGGVVCCVLYAAAGPRAFVLLALLFILTWGATRLGYQRKQKLGIAEKKEGRTASQVLANVGIASICAVAYRWHGNIAFLLAMCAALAEAAADTVSSEVGQTSNRETRLITTWQKVPAGTDGGISLAGTLAGVATALLISLTGTFTGLITRYQVIASVVAAIAGMLCDSFLGATLERRRLINNNIVNFLGTLTAGFLITIWQFAF